MNDDFRSQFDPVGGSLLCLWDQAVLDRCVAMEGDVEALPVNETSVSDIEMSVDFSIQCGFMVDWGLFVLAARWSAAFLSASPAFVVAPPCVVALPWNMFSAVSLVYSRME